MRRVLPLLILLAALSVGRVLAQTTAARRGEITRIKPDEPMMLVFPTFLHTWGMQRAGPTHLRLFMGRRTQFDDPQGIAVTVLDALDDPGDEHDDDELTAYGVNAGRGEILYNPSMFSLDVYGSKGSGQGQFLDPHGIDADPAGNVVVADTGNDRVDILFNDGRVLTHRRYLTGAGGAGALKGPWDVALTPDEGVWVSDPGNARLVLFGLDGSFRRAVDLSGRVDRPGPIARSHPARRWSYFRDDALYVADQEGGVLLRLDPDGKETARITAADLGQRALRIRYMTVDFYSNLWVTDASSGRILKFDRTLAYLGSFGDPKGRGDRFDKPRGIDVWPRFGQMIVAEAEGAQYYWMGADATDLAAEQRGQSIHLSFDLQAYTYLTVRARYEGGGLEEVSRRRFLRVGHRELDLPLKEDRRMAWLEVVVEPTYSSFTYREKVFDLRFTDGGGP